MKKKQDMFKDYIKLPQPTDELDFFEALKNASNCYWADTDVNKGLYGFQIQKGTKWKNGLTDNEITNFENDLGFKFPTPLRNFYKTMNGLDKQGINVFGNSGHEISYCPIYYSYPDDLQIIKESIEWIYEVTNVNTEKLLQEGISRIFPICRHRFVLIDDPKHRVLSMYGNDIIAWADNISKLIATDIFENIYNVYDFESNPNNFDIKFWLDTNWRQKMKNKEIIEKLFEKRTHSKGIHEAVLLVENSKGDFSLSLGYGGKDLHSPLFAASVAKLFVTTCVMVFKEQGKLKLDDKLSKYLEDDVLKGLHTFKGKDYSYDLKLTDLLFHRSGLPCWYQIGGIHERVMNEDFEFPFEKQLANTKGREAKFSPNGKKAFYSDINFGLLGKVIEQISGRHINEVYKEYIFKPLELNKTNFISDENLAIPVWAKDKQIHRPKFLSTHGEQAVVTTANELMVFIKAFFAGKLFSAKVFEELSIYTRFMFPMFSMCGGGGYWQIPLGGLSNLFMGKGELLGHSGSTGSFAFYYPHKDLYFVGDINQMANPALPIRLVMKLAMAVK